MKTLDGITQVILFQIDRTSRLAKLYTQKEFDRLGLGITVDQWVLLKILDEEKMMSQKELANRSSRDAASITRTMDILENKGLVQRGVIEGNRRQYQVSLTDSGVSFVKQNMHLINTHRQKSIDGLSPEEVIALRTTLMKIQDNFM